MVKNMLNLDVSMPHLHQNVEIKHVFYHSSHSPIPNKIEVQ